MINLEPILAYPYTFQNATFNRAFCIRSCFLSYRKMKPEIPMTQSVWDELENIHYAQNSPLFSVGMLVHHYDSTTTN